MTLNDTYRLGLLFEFIDQFNKPARESIKQGVPEFFNTVKKGF